MQNIYNIINQQDYFYYGLRVDDVDYSIGDICCNSHNLFQDPEYDNGGNLIYPKGGGIYSPWYDAGELDGTCAVMIDDSNMDDALARIDNYFGRNIYLIGGDSAFYGNDNGEIVIKNAIVLYKL